MGSVGTLTSGQLPTSLGNPPCYTSASKLGRAMSKKSQWEIVTGLPFHGRPDNEHKRVKRERAIDWNRKRKRPNGEMMTDVEWATHCMQREAGRRAEKGIRTAVVELPANATPSLVPARTLYDLRKTVKG